MQGKESRCENDGYIGGTVMVNVYVDDGQFKVKGTFDFGYIGLYKDDQIGFNVDCSDIRDEWDSVYEMDKAAGGCTNGQIAAYLEKRINEAEKKIQSNIRYINDQFLEHVYDDMDAVGNEFWEREELRVPGFNYDDPDFYFYSFPQDSTNNDFEHMGLPKPFDGSYRHEDGFEAYLRTYKPMFNLDNFINGIEPEHVCMHEDSISFQCSDKFNWQIICAAYDVVDLEDLSFSDWHNY